jgi:hypothetical protein
VKANRFVSTFERPTPRAAPACSEAPAPRERTTKIHQLLPHPATAGHRAPWEKAGVGGKLVRSRCSLTCQRCTHHALALQGDVGKPQQPSERVKFTRCNYQQRKFVPPLFPHFHCFRSRPLHLTRLPNPSFGWPRGTTRAGPGAP